jgi:hypothetical protein
MAAEFIRNVDDWKSEQCKRTRPVAFLPRLSQMLSLALFGLWTGRSPRGPVLAGGPKQFHLGAPGPGTAIVPTGDTAAGELRDMALAKALPVTFLAETGRHPTFKIRLKARGVRGAPFRELVAELQENAALRAYEIALVLGQPVVTPRVASRADTTPS